MTKPEGKALLLEHVRSRSRLLGALADLAGPLMRRLFGREVNRHTERNVEAAGLEIVSAHSESVCREIEARPRVREA